jgi:(p)ppGpp synthase/HD superfamily hydrolase
MNSKMIKKASHYAADAHEGQFRKGGKMKPYITHPIAVSKIVKERGYNIEIQIASILHDIVEDCGGYTLDDISNEFGTSISRLVDYVSESDKSLPWKERKDDYIRRLKEAPFDAVVVSAGDKLHNLRCTAEDFAEGGPDVFKMFNSSTDHQFWFYESLIEIYEENGLTDFTDEMKFLLKDIKNNV